jgi:hypothetical protein
VRQGKRIIKQELFAKSTFAKRFSFLLVTFLSFAYTLLCARTIRD